MASFIQFHAVFGAMPSAVPIDAYVCLASLISMARCLCAALASFLGPVFMPLGFFAFVFAKCNSYGCKKGVAG
jgi:hypothetical protein